MVIEKKRLIYEKIIKTPEYQNIKFIKSQNIGLKSRS